MRDVITYATMIYTDGSVCSIEVMRAPVTRHRDGRVKYVLTGKGETVAMHHRVRVSGERGALEAVCGELARRYETASAPAFNWGVL